MKQIIFLFAMLLSQQLFAQLNLDKEISKRILDAIGLKDNEVIQYQIVDLNYYIESSDVKVLDASAQPVPEQVDISDYEKANCLSIPFAPTAETVQVSVTTGESFSFSQTTTSTQNLTLNIKLPFDLGSSSAGLSRSVALNDSKSWSQSRTETVNRTTSVPEIKPGTVLLIHMVSTISKVSVPVKGSYTINGTFRYKMRCKPFRDMGWQDFEPSERYDISTKLSSALRTFNVDGSVITGKTRTFKDSYNSRPADRKKDCNEPQSKPMAARAANKANQFNRTDLMNKLLKGESISKEEFEALKNDTTPFIPLKKVTKGN